ncbi:hypothetical protein H5410_044555 [Solanum commersonii]|uniref:Cyclin-like domain-containing protein n=1 Tax=Solanum commersonii TaxID=4109 RepID=A0A9J5X759_SOLCO|nr:hypothetical protein H5410_044555 [Solanum commersonii]
MEEEEEEEEEDMDAESSFEYEENKAMANSTKEVEQLLSTEEREILYRNQTLELDKISTNPLHTFALAGQIQFMDRLLEEGLDIDAVDKEGQTALHHAVFGKKEADGVTPLHYAVQVGALQTVKMLIKYKVDVNVADNVGWRPLHVAMQSRNRDIAKVLLVNGADKYRKNKEQLINSPSRKDGIDEVTETALRIDRCDLIQESGILLRLPQAVMATGQVLLHRFYCKKSFARFNVNSVAASCVWLASKLEESREKQGRMECRRENLPIEHLDTSLKKYIDFLRTTLCVRFKSEIVACGVVYAAARRFQVPLPDNPPWWKAFDADKADIDEEGGSFARSRDSPSLPVSKEGLLDVPPVDEDTEEVAKDASDDDSKSMPSKGESKEDPRRADNRTDAGGEKNKERERERDKERLKSLVDVIGEGNLMGKRSQL